MRLLIAAAVLLAGCSLPLAPPPADTTHTLALSANAQIPTGLPAQETLQVALPSVAPGYAGAAIAYRTAPHELRYYARQRWVDRPARLLQQALLDGLAAGGAQVLAPGSGARPDYRLLTNLVQLEQDFTTRPSRVRMTLRVQLVDVNKRRLLGGHTLRLEQAAASDDPAGGVAAANALLERAVIEVARWCQQLTAAVTVPAGNPAPAGASG
jgi:cholesterol transport system auxiliary component